MTTKTDTSAPDEAEAFVEQYRPSDFDRYSELDWYERACDIHESESEVEANAFAADAIHTLLRDSVESEQSNLLVRLQTGLEYEFDKSTMLDDFVFSVTNVTTQKQLSPFSSEKQIVCNITSRTSDVATIDVDKAIDPTEQDPQENDDNDDTVTPPQGPHTVATTTMVNCKLNAEITLVPHGFDTGGTIHITQDRPEDVT